MHKKGKSRGQGEGKNSEASIIHVGIDSFQMLGQQEIIRHISMPVKNTGFQISCIPPNVEPPGLYRSTKESARCHPCESVKLPIFLPCKSHLRSS